MPLEVLMNDRGGFVSQAAALRDSVRWIVATFTGAGAILFSALSVANVTKLAESGAWVLPVALAAIPLAAAVLAVVKANSVLNAPMPAASDLFPQFYSRGTGMTPSQSPDRQSLVESIQRSLPTGIAVYGTLAAFDDRLVRAHKAVERAQSLLDKSPERRQDLENAWSRLDELQDSVREILDCAKYVQTRDRYQKALPAILVAAVLAVLGTISSGIVSGIAAQDRARRVAAANAQKPKSVVFDRVTPVRVYFSGRSVRESAGGPKKCPLWNGVYAWAIGGDFDRPSILFAGYDANDPSRRRLRKAEIGRCSSPRTWAGESGDVTLVPR
jgi:hypothetical protein